MRPALALSLVLGVLTAHAAQARPFTVEDLLATESLGQTLFDPSGRWLVIEHRRPWREAPRFDLNLRTPYRLSRLEVVDRTRPALARPLVAQDAETGLLAGPFAPDGRRLLVYRLRGHQLRAGVVTLATGQVRWLRLTPDLPTYGRAAQWRSAREVVLIARPDGDLPGELAVGWAAGARLAQAAAVTARGVSPSRGRFGSGRFLDLKPGPAPLRLVAVDVVTGAVRTLATGAFVDLEVAPNGRRAALLEDAEAIQPQADERVYIALPRHRRILRLVDLDRGTVTRPCGPADLNRAPIAWSPDGGQLLVAARRPDRAWDSLDLMGVDAAANRCARLDLGGLVPVLRTSATDSLTPIAAWLDAAPAVLATDGGKGRADLYRLTGARPQNLSATLSAAPQSLALSAGRQVWVRTSQGLWRVDAQGRVTPAGGPGRLVSNPQVGAGRIEDLPITSPDGLARLDASGTRLTWDAEGPGPAGVDLTAEDEVLAADGRAALVLRHAANGQQRLDLVSQTGRRTTVARLNAGYADVTPPEIVPIRHAGPHGEALTSWLYLPRDRPAGARLALVVIPYRGQVFGPRPPRSLALGAWNDWANAQILVGAGYAVLAPSLPYDAQAGEPAAHMAADILLAVDAALARGDLDPQRIGLLGQSFGAFNAVAAATQSRRFATVVASAGVYDETALWGAFPLHQWLVPEDGYTPNATAGLVEHAQTGLGAPPWADPQRYQRNSVLFAADQITAPVLILHGQADELGVTQAQELFTALYRQGKDAQLVTYWGEGHTTSSPANIRDRWAIILDWLAKTLGPAPPAAPPPSPTRSGPRPRPSGRS